MVGHIESLNQTLMTLLLLVTESYYILCQVFCELSLHSGHCSGQCFTMYIMQHTLSQPVLTAATYKDVLPYMCCNDCVMEVR